MTPYERVIEWLEESRRTAVSAAAAMRTLLEERDEMSDENDRLAAENADLTDRLTRTQDLNRRVIRFASRSNQKYRARVRELEAALTAFVEAEDINRQYDGTYDSPPGHVVAEMYERAAAMARAVLSQSAATGSRVRYDGEEEE